MLFLHTFFCNNDDDNDNNNNDNTTINQIFLLCQLQKVKASLKIVKRQFGSKKLAILEKNSRFDNFDNDDNHDQGVMEKIKNLFY